MNSRKPLFSPDSPSGKTLADWWRGLENDRGARAELRRARSPEDASLIPATINLITLLRGTPVSEHSGWQSRIPAIAGLSSRLDADARSIVLAAPNRDALPRRMASPKGDRPRVSELRFRRILQTHRDELYRPMIRVLAQLDNQISLFDLADTLFWWGPQIQKSWAFAYFPALKKPA